MPHIVLLATGGTIAMEVKPGTYKGAVPSLQGKDFQDKLQELIPKDIRLSVEDIVNVPGAHLTIENMVTLCRRIHHYTFGNDVDGIVVSQGTDAIEECSFFVNLCYGGIKPVVFTGAMRTASEVGYDGFRNLLSAVIVAANKQAENMGVLLVMNQQIHSAVELRKMHTLRTDAFQSPHTGPVGEVVFDKVDITRRIQRSSPVLEPLCRQPVVILPMVLDIDDEILAWISTCHPKGVIIEGLGGGRVPPKILPVIEKLIRAGVPVVETTRGGIGHVYDRYGFAGCHADLKILGVLFAHNLSSAKARIKLMLALGNAKSNEALREYFNSSVD